MNRIVVFLFALLSIVPARAAESYSPLTSILAAAVQGDGEAIRQIATFVAQNGPITLPGTTFDKFTDIDWYGYGALHGDAPSARIVEQRAREDDLSAIHMRARLMIHGAPPAIDHDPRAAYYMLKHTADDKHDALAYVMLAEMTERGIGTMESQKDACDFWAKAAELSEPLAQMPRYRCAKQMDDLYKDQTYADFQRLAPDLPAARVALAGMHEEGIVFPVDLNAAVGLWQSVLEDPGSRDVDRALSAAKLGSVYLAMAEKNHDLYGPAAEYLQLAVSYGMTDKLRVYVKVRAAMGDQPDWVADAFEHGAKTPQLDLWIKAQAFQPPPNACGKWDSDAPNLLDNAEIARFDHKLEAWLACANQRIIDLDQRFDAYENAITNSDGELPSYIAAPYMDAWKRYKALRAAVVGDVGVAHAQMKRISHL